jgi:hypothetical protein
MVGRGIVDASVIIDALDLPTVNATLDVDWWGDEWVICSLVVNYFPASPRSTEVGRIENMRALPVVAQLFKQGEIELLVADVTQFERGKARKSETHDFFGVDVGEFKRIETDEFNETWRRCLSPLRTPTNKDFEETADSVTHPRFVELKRILGRKHQRDTFGVWLAEREGLDFVLTMDARFCRHFAQMNRHHRSSVRVIEPRELVAEKQRELASDEILKEIRDIFRQQRIAPMCQLRWPRSWRKRIWMLMTTGVEYRPTWGKLHIPNSRDLAVALLTLEFGKRK